MTHHVGAGCWPGAPLARTLLPACRTLFLNSVQIQRIKLIRALVHGLRYLNKVPASTYRPKQSATMHETTAPSAKTAIFDEMHTPEGGVRTHYQEIASQLFSLPLEALSQKQREAEMLFRRLGITFAVYGEGSGAERLIPFDVIPRVFGASEWALLERGLKQRVQALNAFLHDIYHNQEIIKAGLIPAEQVLGY